MTGRSRANGEGSIYPRRNGFAAYAWVTTPAGKRTRKYVYGPDRETVHAKWVKLLRQAQEGAVATRVPTLGSFLTGWLDEVVKPNLAPATYANYEMFSRLYITPSLAASGSIGSPSAMCRSGSTPFRVRASAVRKASTSDGVRRLGAAAPQGVAAVEWSHREPSPTPARHSGQRCRSPYRRS
ncbi:MAG: hypothetical protein ACJ73E_10020 [Mycobacteriales bacterium]